MSDAIRVDNLGKKYLLRHQGGQPYLALRDVLADGVKELGRRLLGGRGGGAGVPAEEEFWALRDVSFRVGPGDRIGIVGRNGAGKSTLLKILSRITEPSQGRVRIRGRVASLLEVGTGFHPELTGRENVFLNGAILGMSRREIRRKFDEIVAFAEVERFLDTPVKRYSSGMYVRLAFAVAAHLEPEILIVDEVLAVGDLQFQKKCLGKMEAVSAEEGRTVLFVSHNLAAVKSLCNRSMLMHEGTIVGDGDPATVIETFMNMSGGPRRLLERRWPADAHAPQNGFVALAGVRVVDGEGNVPELIQTDTSFDIEITYRVKVGDALVGLTIMVSDSDNVLVLSSINNRDAAWYGTPQPPGTFRSRCRMPSNLLNNGHYSISLNLFGPNFTEMVTVKDVLGIEVHDCQTLRGDYFGTWGGVVRPDLRWTTTMETETL